MLINLINTIKPQIPDTDLPDKFMVGFLNASDNTPEFSRESTYVGYSHVSSLSKDFCSRRYAIMHKEDMATHVSLTGGHRVTFAIGRHVEKYIREGFIKQYGRHKVYATWETPNGEKYTGFCKAPANVEHKYHEVDLVDNDYNITGHPDLIFMYENKLRVVEIKSMNKDDFNELTAPLPEHIIQASMYPRMMEKQGLDVSDEVIILYVQKEFKFGSPYKEFHVKTKDNEALLKAPYSDAAQLKEYWNSGKMPDRICKSEKTSFAKRCCVSGRCFTSYT